jgi:hypothetical protein
LIWQLAGAESEMESQIKMDKSKFMEFLKNPTVRVLLHFYQKGTIKSASEFNGELRKKGITISLTTLYKYLAEIKKVFNLFLFQYFKIQASANDVPETDEIRFETAISKYDNENMLLVGKNGENNWRKFRFID